MQGGRARSEAEHQDRFARGCQVARLCLRRALVRPTMYRGMVHERHPVSEHLCNHITVA